MELKDFIQGALQQIIEGIEACQGNSNSLPAVVNPSGIEYDENLGSYTIINGIVRPVQNVEFEVGLTSSEKEGNKGGISVFFSGVGIGGQKNNETGNTASTSLKFSVSIAFPAVESQRPIRKSIRVFNSIEDLQG